MSKILIVLCNSIHTIISFVQCLASINWEKDLVIVYHTVVFSCNRSLAVLHTSFAAFIRSCTCTCNNCSLSWVTIVHTHVHTHLHTRVTMATDRPSHLIISPFPECKHLINNHERRLCYVLHSISPVKYKLWDRNELLSFWILPLKDMRSTEPFMHVVDSTSMLTSPHSFLRLNIFYDDCYCVSLEAQDGEEDLRDIAHRLQATAPKLTPSHEVCVCCRKN